MNYLLYFRSPIEDGTHTPFLWDEPILKSLFSSLVSLVTELLEKASICLRLAVWRGFIKLSNG